MIKKYSKEQLLWFALLLTGGFLIVDVAGGIMG